MSLIKWNEDYLTTLFKLNNTGTLCYLNSLIQCLMSLPAFNETLVNNYSPEIGCKNDILQSIYNLYSKNKYRDIPSNEIKTETTRSVLAAMYRMRMKHQAYSIGLGSQEDAGEALKFILECLGDKFAEVFHVSHKMVIKCLKCEKKHMSNNAPTEIFINMSANNSQIHGELDNKEAIENHIKICMIAPEDYKCENCDEVNTKTKSNIRQFYYLSEMSSVLVLSFHGFQHNLINGSYKREARYFPQTLDFITESKKKLHYKVVAQIEQFGNLNFGHYTANCHKGSQVKIYDERKQKIQKFMDRGGNITPSLAAMAAEETPESMVFNLNDNRLKYMPNGVVPSQHTYLVFYHLV